MKKIIKLILVILLLTINFTPVFKIDEVKSNHDLSHLENQTNDSHPDNSLYSTRKSNSNSFITLDAGGDIITYVNLTTNFTALASHPIRETIEYFWDFQNNGTVDMSTLEIEYDEPSEVNYSFNKSGNYTVKVEAKDYWGNFSSGIDFINVWVKNGTGYQETIDKIDYEMVFNNQGQSLPPDGTIDIFSVMINGGKEKRFWDDVELTYDMLIDEYEYSEDNIILLNHNGLNPDGENPEDMIDYAATPSNINTVFNNLRGEIDGDDILFLWVTDHGSGMFDSEDYSNYGFIPQHVCVTVDPGDEQDYLESDFQIRSFVSGATEPMWYFQNMGMDEWGCRRQGYLNDPQIFYRHKYVSTFPNTFFEKWMALASDDDIFIEKIIDLLEGDYNQNFWLEPELGEVADFDDDGNPPYNHQTGVYDEDDWGLPYEYKNVFTIAAMGDSFGTKHILWDKDYDNHVDIDVDTTYYDNGVLEVDGTDIDNEGLFDGVDVNDDGDMDDWVSIDESFFLDLENKEIMDDELALLLKDFNAGRIIAVFQPCFSGGFIWDIRGPKRMTLTAETQHDLSMGNSFIRGITAAFHWKDENGDPVDADSNEDGKISVTEAFNYAALCAPSGDTPQFDDNGDGISHEYPIPDDDDGKLGEKTFLDDYDKSENPPNKPTKPSGEINGLIKEEYTYNTSTTDQDGDQVFYLWDWGDDSFSDWLGPYDSNEICEATHTWNKKGTYSIKVKAMDLFGDESDWSDPLAITMPVNQYFGCSSSGVFSSNIQDEISGSNFTALANGTADCIIAFVQTNLSVPPKTKCMIYEKNSSTLIGSTEEKTFNTGDDGIWVVYNFSNSKPNVSTNTEYILTCWSNDTCNLFYKNSTYNLSARYKNHSYGTAPTPTITWDDNESRIYSIFCGYSTIPEIKNVSDSPNNVGLGFNTTISADVELYNTTIEYINVSITYPNCTAKNFSMNQSDNYTFQYTFDDTWMSGQYNYTIWLMNEFCANCSSSGNSFNVSSHAIISACTIQDDYEENELINLTDPPINNPSLIGYELVEEGSVLHIWNQYDSYYFDTESGMQMTNHYDEYWTHNVMMLGYYNNNQWNLVYRTDELSGFNKNIDTDNETYVNATLWKDLTYQGYDFRLAIRYHLSVDDNELTVIPYIKNLGEDIPYELGFGWEMKDIQIDMTKKGDYIEVDGSSYYLNQTLDNSYTDLEQSEFYLMENITGSSTRSLYLRWNESLTYKLQVKSREGQFNAPVTLFVKIGTLDSDQEKYTMMYWYDADQLTYYFNSYDNRECWPSSPSLMVDGNMVNYASTTVDGDIELCDGNNCSGDDLGVISKIEMRICAYYASAQRDILLRPVFGGTTDGEDIRYTPTLYANIWSSWFDITNDPYAPGTWTWNDVVNLDCDVEVESNPCGPPFTMYSSKIEIRVTYATYVPPEITNPVPANGETGVSISPVLNITVTDANGNSMDIIWLSNSSGSWQTFGVNNSVSNGTYHQVFLNATENGKWWYWKLNVTDGNDYNESSVFKFYTGCQSKIKNTGSYNFKGYLLIQVQCYNSTSENWEIADDTINEITTRTINASDQFGLDTIFNGLVNTSNLSSFGNGTYRIYTAFRDPYGDVLVCEDETELEATYEFTISFE